MLGRPHTSPHQRAPLSVGARVSTRHSRVFELPEHLCPRHSGVNIEDFSDLPAHTTPSYGGSWALTCRATLALDDGSLIFGDPTNLDPEPHP